MKNFRNSTERKVALVAAGAAAALGIGVAAGAYGFAGSSTNWTAASPATRAVAVEKLALRQTAHSTKRAVPNRPAPALSTFDGKLSLDDGLVKLKVLRIVGAGNSQRSWQLFEHRAVLDVGPRVRIVDGRGMQIAPALVDDAIARVHGRLLPASAWRWSDDELRPVIRAQRIVVLRLDREFGD
jgi:hypothetical protein